MQMFPSCLSLLLAVPLAAQSARPPALPALPAIPAIQGTTFAGDLVSLPGHSALLVIGFSQATRQQVAAWGHRLANDPHRPPTLTYYEMPVLASVPRFLRGFVLKQIKDEVSPLGRHHFLPILDHEKEWRHAAAYASPDAAYILVIDAAGIIRWHTAQPLSDQTYAEALQQAELVR